MHKQFFTYPAFDHSRLVFEKTSAEKRGEKVEGIRKESGAAKQKIDALTGSEGYQDESNLAINLKITG